VPRGCLGGLIIRIFSSLWLEERVITASLTILSSVLPDEEFF